MSDFLDRLLNPEKHAAKRKKKLSRRTIRTDKYDDRTYERALEAMPDLDTARHRFCDTVETGNGMTADVWQMLFKVEPEHMVDEDIRPDYLINALVRNELQGLNELAEVRGLGTVGDEVSASLGFIAMREDVESIYDRTKKEQELLEQLLEDQQQAMKSQKNLTSVQKAMQDLLDQLAEAMEAVAAEQVQPDEDEDGDEGEGGEGEDGEPCQGPPSPNQQLVAALQAQIEALQEHLDALTGAQESLEEKMAAAKEAVEQGLDAARPDIRRALQHGLDEAIDQAKDLQSLTTSWGMDPGCIQRMDAKERLAKAKQIKDSPKLKQLADLVGRYTRVARAEQRKQVRPARCEITDIEIGDDLTRLLPDEFVLLRHPKLRKIFRKKYAERSLLQFELGGTEKVGMGSLICEWDGSGSMQGDPEIGAKAVAIALLNIAQDQKRSFTGVQFSSSSELRQWDFHGPEDYTPEKIFDLAEFFYNGGTDFMAPLSLGLSILQEENAKTGAVRGDIVFITDGYAGMNDAWLAEFKAEQARLGFHVFGVLIGGGNVTSEPLNTICDGRVVEWKNFLSPDEFRGVFRDIHKPE